MPRQPIDLPFAPPMWPALNNEKRRVRDLHKNPRNAKKHPPAQIEMVRRSIKTFGWTMPILVDEKNLIIAGHARLEAAVLEKIEEVPVVVARGWSKQQKDAYLEADNRLTEIGEYDEDLRRALLAELLGQGFDMLAVGWQQDDLSAFLAVPNMGDGDPEDAPEPPAKPIVREGDLWTLGNHRLLCGDSTRKEDVARVIGKAAPNLMVTDPPYGVSYDPNWRNEPGKLNLKSTTAFKGRNAAKGKVRNDHRSDWSEAWALFPGDVAYVWHGERQCPEIAQHFEKLKFARRNLIVWAKDGLVISRGHYHPQHESCWYFVREGATANWHGDRKQSTLWQISRNRANETGHGTQKPIDCMKRPMENNSRPGESVYEPFSGSGTTIIAAEMTGRHCIAIELDPAYVEVAVERWQKFTGQEATLDGVPFSKVRASRRKEKPDATRDSGKPVRGEKLDRPVAKQKVRAALSSP